MTQPNVPDQPAYGSVDYFTQFIRARSNSDDLFYSTVTGTFIGVARNLRDGYATVRAMTNLLTAVELLVDERAAARRSDRCGGDCTLVAGHSGDHAFRDPTGLDYSRDVADDPTPVSPARAPLHVGVMDDGGLVDVTPEVEPHCTPACDALSVPHAPTGRDRHWHSDDCPVGELMEREQQPVHFLMTSGVTACDLKLVDVGAWSTTALRGETTCEDCHDGIPD